MTYSLFGVKLRECDLARKLIAFKMIGKGIKEVVGESQGLFLSVFKGLKVIAVPKERSAGCGEGTLDGFRLADMSIVYHDGILGQLKMLVKETYANKLLNIECHDQMAKSLKGGIREGGSVIDVRQGAVDGRGDEVGREHFH